MDDPQPTGVTKVSPSSIDIVSEPVDPDQVVDGRPTTGWAMIDSFAGMDVGVWEHSVGASTDIEEDEVFVVLSGRATVTVDGGETYEFGPGDVGILRAGTPTTWVVHDTIRKVFVGASDE